MDSVDTDCRFVFSLETESRRKHYNVHRTLYVDRRTKRKRDRGVLDKGRNVVHCVVSSVRTLIKSVFPIKNIMLFTTTSNIYSSFIV